MSSPYSGAKDNNLPLGHLPPATNEKSQQISKGQPILSRNLITFMKIFYTFSTDVIFIYKKYFFKKNKFKW